jgi:hypothetical protein
MKRHRQKCSAYRSGTLPVPIFRPTTPLIYLFSFVLGFQFENRITIDVWR